MTEPRVNLEELKAAEAAATPGPWFFHPIMEMDDDSAMRKPTNLGWVSTNPKDDYLTVVERSWDGDALFIALMRNALPALIAEVEASRAYIKSCEDDCGNVQRFDALCAEKERVHALFVQETLRTSEQYQLLERAAALLCETHRPGAWSSKGCQRCALVGEIEELANRPMNAPADATHEQVIGGREG